MKHRINIRGVMVPNDYKWYYDYFGEDCTCPADIQKVMDAFTDGDEIEVKAAVGLNVLVLRQWEEQLIDQVEEKPLDMKKIEAMPGITVYMVKQEDTLWDRARQFYTTVDEICAVNGITEKEVKAGQPLLLIKQVQN